MDLEPGRCRRTDGKKWRCRQAVLPDQKYCERHIHRGCLRSRKPVEKSTATITVSPLKAAINLQSAAKSDARNHKSVCVKNHSFKITKRSLEDARGALRLFPKNVVQNGNVQHSGTSSKDDTHHLAVPISERCRRTDGKKWQCTKGVLQGQKYCAQHMHRGAKKVHNRQNFITTLSFPIEASYQQKSNSVNQSNESSTSDDDETNSSSSDATTISM